MKDKIRLDGKYRQINGIRVLRVLCIDAENINYPVIVQMENKRVESYTEDGKFYCNESGAYPLDLVEISGYEDIPIDAKGWVWDDDGGVKKKRHFAGVSNAGKPLAWQDGKTSWSTFETVSWDHFEVADAPALMPIASGNAAAG